LHLAPALWSQLKLAAEASGQQLQADLAGVVEEAVRSREG
jgi:hypothetical protein